MTQIILRGKDGRMYNIARQEHRIDLGLSGDFVTRTQFPLQQANACTIHKSQGMNISSPYAGDLTALQGTFRKPYMQRALATVVVSRGTSAEYLRLVYRKHGQQLASPVECEELIRGLFTYRDADPDVQAYRHVVAKNVLASECSART